MPDEALASAIGRAVADLPPAQLHKLAEAVARHDQATALARHAIVNVVPTAVFRHHAASICERWANAAPLVNGGGVALAIRVATDAVRQARGEEQVSVVWTGPSSYEVPLRATGAVLLDLIEEAQRDLIVVSFAAYKVPDVVQELRAAASRGVDIRLVLESVVESRGNLSRDASEAFETLGDAVKVYVWPAELRVSAGGGHASMHAKCAVADGEVAFVTSANLTGAALTNNMELGLLVRGGDVPQRIGAQFADLIARGVLRQLT